MAKIPDEAIVMRGGRNRSEDIERGIGTHPSGITGISVECAVGVSIAELATAIPHGQLGITTWRLVIGGWSVVNRNPSRTIRHNNGR